MHICELCKLNVLRVILFLFLQKFIPFRGGCFAILTVYMVYYALFVVCFDIFRSVFLEMPVIFVKVHSILMSGLECILTFL